MRPFVFAAVLSVLALTGWATSDAPKVSDFPHDPLHPRDVAAGIFEKWQQEAAKHPNWNATYTRVEYEKRTFWVVDVHFGWGTPYTTISVYAPAKDGSFRRCLLAESNRAGSLAVAVDAKTGMLELRERANSTIKDEVVLSCNLKTIGTTYSTSAAP